MPRPEKDLDPGRDPASILGAQLRKARRSRGMSAQSLGRGVKYSRSYIVGVETGHVVPSKELLTRCEDHLDLPQGTLTAYLDDLLDSRSLAREVLDVAGDPQEPRSEPMSPRPQPRAFREHEVVQGFDACVEAATRFLRPSTPRDPVGTNLTLLTELKATAGRSPFVDELYDDLCSFLKQEESSIDHVWCLPQRRGDLPRTFVPRLMKLLKFPGKYRPRLFVGPSPFGASDVLTSEVGFLLLFRGDAEVVPTKGAFFRGEKFEALHALVHDEVDRLRQNAPQVVTVFKEHDKESRLRTFFKWFEETTKIESRDGPRFVVRRELPFVLLPFEVDKRRIESWLETSGSAVESRTMKDQLSTFEANRRRRRDEFDRQAQVYPFRHVCSYEALESFVDKGLFHATGPEVPPGDPGRPFEFYVYDAGERAAWIGEVVKALKSSSFELGLYSGRRGDDVTRVNWGYKGVPGAPIVWGSELTAGASPPITGLTIDLPSVAEAFRVHFEEAIWNRIPFLYRSKDWVINHLEKRINELQDL